MMANGKPSDPMRVHCNGKDYNLEGGTTLKCTGNWDDMGSTVLNADDFKNGSEGSYEWVPITK